jgi:lysosomal-associated membrane protein 1/2
MIKGAIEISVTYQDKDKKNQTANIDVPISPKDAVDVSGDCLNGMIHLKWSTSGHDNFISFVFEKNETVTVDATAGISAGKYALQDVNGTLYKDPALFVNITDPGTDFNFSMMNKAAFQTPLNHSYSCMQQEILKSDDGLVSVKLSDIRLEAFRKTAQGHKDFSAAIDCPADDASDIVPIAVGAALAGLVVIVLIAYLIGRRRSRSRGYQSV